VATIKAICDSCLSKTGLFQHVDTGPGEPGSGLALKRAGQFAGWRRARRRSMQEGSLISRMVFRGVIQVSKHVATRVAVVQEPLHTRPHQIHNPLDCASKAGESFERAIR
jgi:hypothetical protein